MPHKADINHLRYPIGKFEKPCSASPEQIRAWTEIIAVLPEKLAQLTETLGDDELHQTYRPDG